ncbi:MAG TPA: hypothetical protein IAA98_01985 [Candidatus Avipropionibacterium avicola]|uniref:DUF3592 domain-containing protein n=1 Tax=Candidatus Avipropionibacterium avicola TaxID=2840701 RepID=A0A9D1GVY8_9ACTN|nr:hypothetical protein [Candidatus Avipropionibacterium avicola]
MDTQLPVVLTVTLALACLVAAVRIGLRFAAAGHRNALELARGRQVRRTGTCVRAEVLAVHALGDLEVQVLAEFETPGGRRIATGRIGLAEPLPTKAPEVGDLVRVWYLGEGGSDDEVQMDHDLDPAELAVAA